MTAALGWIAAALLAFAAGAAWESIRRGGSMDQSARATRAEVRADKAEHNLDAARTALPALDDARRQAMGRHPAAARRTRHLHTVSRDGP